MLSRPSIVSCFVLSAGNSPVAPVEFHQLYMILAMQGIEEGVERGRHALERRGVAPQL